MCVTSRGSGMKAYKEPIPKKPSWVVMFQQRKRRRKHQVTRLFKTTVPFCSFALLAFRFYGLYKHQSYKRIYSDQTEN